MHVSKMEISKFDSFKKTSDRCVFKTQWFGEKTVILGLIGINTILIPVCHMHEFNKNIFKTLILKLNNNTLRNLAQGRKNIDLVNN